jgi:basic membrane protein A
MRSVAPDSALTSATNNWAAYYKTALRAAYEGTDIPTNWAQGYQENAVAITELGTAVAAGTAEKVAEVEAALKNGTLAIFDTQKFTVGGVHLTEYLADTDGDFVGETNVIDANGVFQESDAENFRAAPYFDIKIDGIKQNLKEEA